MKPTIILFFVSVSLLLSSCIKNVLDKQDKLPAKVMSMQLLDPEPIVAADTGYFPIFASTSGAKFVKFSVEHSSNFQGFISKTFFQVANDVIVNANGEFSKPVASILLNYPIKASLNTGEILTVKFTFTDEDGSAISVSASKKVVNFKTNAAQEFLFVTRPFYNFYTGKASAPSVLNNNNPIRDSLDVFWLRENGIQYLLSPDANKTAQYFATMPTVSYNQSLMRHTKFIKLNGRTLNDIDDEAFAAMDFTNATDVIVLEHKALYGVLLQNGRKAALDTEIYLTIYSRVRSRYQIN